MTCHYEFNRIYQDYYDQILRYLKRLIHSSDAEDVTQDVFVKIEQGLKTFRGDSKLTTWMYKIATNTALDHLKSSSVKQSANKIPFDQGKVFMDKTISGIQKKLSADRAIVQNEMGVCVREYVDRLPDNYRTVIILSELNEFKNQEIADILDISLDAVKIRLHRARTLLKTMLDDGCDFYHNEDNVFTCDRKQHIKNKSMS